MKALPVKNRAPASIQISAEQLVLEARDRSLVQAPAAPARHVADVAELAEHRLRVRKEFEDSLRMHRHNTATWLRYARWEEGAREVERARSVYERCLDLDYKNSTVWLRYAELEMKAGFLARARNVWDRAVTLLPRVDALWYKYVAMEEVLGNAGNARALFTRWMEWEPDERAWQTYANFEVRAGGPGAADRARAVYERFLACHPSEAAYIKVARWEARGGQRALARRVYERALDELRPAERGERLFAAFAAFEESCGEHARARAIFRAGLECLPKTEATALYQAYVNFEKKFGDRTGVEDVIVAKRRAQYEDAVTANPLDYDAWFDLARLEEEQGEQPRIRDVYERAVAAVPPVAEKRFWRRYVYLWLKYAAYEELRAHDIGRARAVYAAALRVIPHAAFTFGKLWLAAAHLEVRALDIGAARKLLGASLGLSPKRNVLRGYIELETALGEIERVRRLHEREVTLWPFSAPAWARFAALEARMGETARARAVHELAISQPTLDMPEAAWKAYIDFEIESGDAAAARALYERLLARTSHVKVWLSLAAFEASVVGDAAGARAAYSRAHAHFKAAGADAADDRATIAETWAAFEQGLLEDEQAAAAAAPPEAAAAAAAAVDAATVAVASVRKLLPRRIIKRRPVLAADGTETGASEEYAAWLFPDDETQPASLKLLELAQRWKAAGGGSVDAVLRGGAASSAAAVSTVEDLDEGEAGAGVSAHVGAKRSAADAALDGGDVGAADMPAAVRRRADEPDAGVEEGGGIGSGDGGGEKGLSTGAVVADTNEIEL